MKTIKNWNVLGIGAASTVMVAWASGLVFLLSAELSWWLVLFGVPVQTFLYTGLFITAHDAMHGTVSPRFQRVNDAFGTAAVWLYALFSFRKMRSWHREHHRHPGVAGEDPDFHDGTHAGFWRWYGHFVGNYVTWRQIVGMAVVFNVLEHVVGVSMWNLLVFWVAPSLLSTLQLFYFGTYRPHRGEPDNVHRARSNAYSPFWSFVTCYHFGYHLEHHETPWAPWWYLPRVRAEALARGAS